MRTGASTFESLALAAIVLFASVASAIGQDAVALSANPTVVPQMTRYSGVAAERAAGTVEMVFRIYPDAEGGEALWSETQQVAVGQEGKYTVLLGAVAEGGLPQTVFSGGQARWLGVTIAGAPEQPRVPLDSAAYAMKAADAETLGGVPAADFVTQSQLRAHPQPLPVTPGTSSKSSKSAQPNDVSGSGSGNTVAMWTGNASLGNSALTQSGSTISTSFAFQAGTIIGRSSSAAKNSAAISGNQTSATGIVFGVLGSTNSTTAGAVGVSGSDWSTTGAVTGVSGQVISSTAGALGVFGVNWAKTGQVYGVKGMTSSSGLQAAGVTGIDDSATGLIYGVSGLTGSSGVGASGVWGVEWSATGVVYGVSGQSNSATANAAGVYAYAEAATGATQGVSALDVSTSGTGVLGVASAKTGATVGVSGQSASTSGVGVLGETTASGATAGKFVNAAGSGLILEGLSKTTKVFSVDSSGNGTFAGNLSVTGKVTKGSGSFKIDDPLEPEKKYLSHSFVESPDMMNVYNGNIVTDKHGVAMVVLPDYFEALNRDFRYQLTVIGQLAQAYVAREIEKNHFVIRTSKPGVKVSWLITGIRKDAYANANRIPVEEEKPAEEQGYYLHPEAFGQPASKSIAAAHQAPASPDEVQLSQR